jgi:hypothetical protein
MDANHIAAGGYSPYTPRSSPAGVQVVRLVSAGVTRIERTKVATVLAELADGTAPSTVARRVGVGYATVARIAERTKTPPLNGQR